MLFVMASLTLGKPFVEICNRNIRVGVNDVGMAKCV